MNVKLFNVTYISEDPPTFFEHLMVAGKRIRYVHLPVGLNARQTVTQYEKILDRIAHRNQPHKIKN